MTGRVFDRMRNLTGSTRPAPLPTNGGEQAIWQLRRTDVVSELTGQPWFGWASAVVIGLPVALLMLTEMHASLARRGSGLAKPVNLLRNYVLPVGALLILVIQATDVSVEVTWVRSWPRPSGSS